MSAEKVVQTRKWAKQPVSRTYHSAMTAITAMSPMC